jgi:anti-sigma-K factor RskA
MTNGTHIALEDLAALAMRSAAPSETAAVEEHLAQCERCRAEFEKLSSELAMVAMSVDQKQLPEGARERFIQRIPNSPATSNLASIAKPSPKRAKTALMTTWLPWSLAAVLALVAIGMGFQIRSLVRENRDQTRMLSEFAYTQSRAQKVLDVLTAPDAQHVLLTTTGKPARPSARAIYLPSKGGLILQASNMGQLTQEWTYELWVIPANGNAPIPAGLFRPDATGSASVVLPELPSGVHAKAFGVTVERAEGSQKPTLPIILSGSAPSS